MKVLELFGAIAVVSLLFVAGCFVGAWAERRATCSKAVEAQVKYFESHAKLAEWQMSRPVVTVAGPEAYTPAETTFASPAPNSKLDELQPTPAEAKE